MNNLVIGNGEIGSALLSIIKEYHFCGFIDIDRRSEDIKTPIDIMHITIRYSDQFVEIVDNYIKEFNPEIVIIESTVAVGTCRKIQNLWLDVDVFHSPVRGRHGDFKSELLKFEKYISGKRNISRVAAYYVNMGFNIRFCSKWETTELGKLLSTAQYGHDLVFADEMKRICDEFEVDYNEAVKHFNETYNLGYKGTQFQRSILDPPNKKIGGHCVVPNAKILNQQIESKQLKEIIKYE